jgi:hypothetical protein
VQLREEVGVGHDARVLAGLDELLQLIDDQHDGRAERRQDPQGAQGGQHALSASGLA